MCPDKPEDSTADSPASDNSHRTLLIQVVLPIVVVLVLFVGWRGQYGPTRCEQACVDAGYADHRYTFSNDPCGGRTAPPGCRTSSPPPPTPASCRCLTTEEAADRTRAHKGVEVPFD